MTMACKVFKNIKRSFDQSVYASSIYICIIWLIIEYSIMVSKIFKWGLLVQKSANTSDTDTKKNEDNNENNDKDKYKKMENWEEKKFKVQKIISLDIRKLEIKCNK